MELLRHDEGDSDEARSGASERLSGGPYAPAAVGELTVRELDLQRRLVRESLLLRPA
jgi:hypothetical protein